MKKPDRITVAFGAIVLAATVAVGGFSAYAAGGDESDPLVTLSYLTQVVTPQLLEKVDEQVQANEQALSERLDAAISDYSRQMEQALSQGQGTGKGSSYTVVPVEAGQTLLLEAGGELLLRSGEAAVSAGASPVLLDATSASSLEVGGTLTANHLYVVPLEGMGITVSAPAIFLVRGAYSIV